MSDDAASELWKLRQVVHGRNVFSVKRLEVLGSMVMELRAAVLLLLKQRLGVPEDELPLMQRADGPILGHGMVAIGHRELQEDDLEAVALLSAL